MTNKERYKEMLENILFNCIGITDTGKIFMCPEDMACNDNYNEHCKNCIFDCKHKSLPEQLTMFKEWLNSEYKSAIDWSKISIDTKIEYSANGKVWFKAYYAGFLNENNIPEVFADGATSWSVSMGTRPLTNAKYICFPDGEIDGIIKL